MKKLITLFSSVLLIASLLVGCSSNNTASTESQTTDNQTADKAATVAAAAPAEKIIIGVSQKTNTNPYNIQVADAIKAAMKEGDEVIFTDAQQNQGKQINDVDDLIQQSCNVIIISPVDWQGTRGMLEACERAGVYAIVIDQNIPEDDAELAASVVCSDNYEAGRLCAEDMVKRLDGKGEIVIYESSVSRAGVDRVAGFEDYLKDYPDMITVNRQDGFGQIEVALPVMENMLQADPGITGVFGFNDPAAIGCIAAIESANKLDDIVVYGVDGSEQGAEMVEDGKMAGTAAQYPAEIGTKAIETAYSLCANESVEDKILIPVKLITAENVAEYRNQ